MLEKAGVSFIREPATIDESQIKAEITSNGSDSRQTALALAEAKARDVAIRRPDVMVIGSDQILECDGKWFDKPATRTDAMRTLQKLRARNHMLVSAVAVITNGSCLWQFVDVAHLTMRPFSDEFLHRYMDKAGDGILESVGAYRIEGMGIQLFSRIKGDHFTVLGMPLLPLLDFLRRRHVLES